MNCKNPSEIAPDLDVNRLPTHVAVIMEYFGDEPVALLHFGRIRLVDSRNAAELTDLFVRLFQLVQAARHQQDMGAGLGQTQSGVFANAGGRAGDENDFVFDVSLQ